MGVIGTCSICGGESWQYGCPECDAETIADLKDQVAELKERLREKDLEFCRFVKQHEWCDEEIRLTREEVVAQTRAKEQLEQELARYKDGNLSTEEMSELCHNLPPGKVCEFRQGCLRYQLDLFGQDQVQSDLARELRWALRQVSCHDGENVLAEAMAKTLLQKEDRCNG